MQNNWVQTFLEKNIPRLKQSSEEIKVDNKIPTEEKKRQLKLLHKLIYDLEVYLIEIQ